MGEAAGPQVGTIGWHDLTVEHAEAVRDFYTSVVGWKSEDVDMGGYADYQMLAPGSGEGVAGGQTRPPHGTALSPIVGVPWAHVASNSAPDSRFRPPGALCRALLHASPAP
jgi:predicted enzyme related to lactoylglutathione lyase